MALRQQNLPQRPLLIEHPSVHRAHEAIATDEVHLHGENAEQQITIGRIAIDGLRHGGTPWAQKEHPPLAPSTSNLADRGAAQLGVFIRHSMLVWWMQSLFLDPWTGLLEELGQ